MKKFKLIIFILLIVITGSYTQNVAATSFQSSEWVEGIYRNKEVDGVVVSSRQERIMRDSITGEIAYCIEPFTDLKNGYEFEKEYKEYSPEIGISQLDYDRITRLAYYGYNYGNHTNPKWYSITQILIWRTIDKTTDYYWVDEVFGNRIEPYQNEIKELEDLIIKDISLPPLFEGKKMTIGKEYILPGGNNALLNYKIVSSDVTATIVGKDIQLKSDTEGRKRIVFEDIGRTYNDTVKIYVSDNSQNVLKVGNYIQMKVAMDFFFYAGKLEITKIDKDSKMVTPSGEASLVGAIYGLYDEDNNLLKELVVGEDNKAVASNIPFGSYTLKEIQSGKGYYLDKKTYAIIIDEEKTDIKLQVENEVIKSKIIIHKYYGNEQKWLNEKNVRFDIFTSSGKHYKEVITDHSGKIEIILPYGEYKFIQLNTADNYQMVNSFTITVNENSEEILLYDLYDLEIDSPNASTGIETINIVYYIRREQYA